MLDNKKKNKFWDEVGPEFRRFFGGQWGRDDTNLSKWDLFFLMIVMIGFILFLVFIAVFAD